MHNISTQQYEIQKNRRNCEFFNRKHSRSTSMPLNSGEITEEKNNTSLALRKICY